MNKQLLNMKEYALFIVVYDFKEELENECAKRNSINDAPCDMAFDIAKDVVNKFFRNFEPEKWGWDYTQFITHCELYFE